VDLGLQKNVAGNKVTVRLAVNDVFKGTGSRSEQRLDGFSFSSYGYYETRQVRLNVTYKFADAAAKGPGARSWTLANENGRIRN